jgi:hypothetical protein
MASMPEIAPSAGADGRWQTSDGQHRLSGVLAIAVPGGCYELELHLAARWPPPPLAKLAAAVRERVRADAHAAGLGDLLAQVQVHIDDVIEPPARALPSAGSEVR